MKIHTSQTDDEILGNLCRKNQSYLTLFSVLHDETTANNMRFGRSNAIVNEMEKTIKKQRSRLHSKSG